MSQSCHCRGGRSDVEISHKMFRIRRSLPKIRSDPARLPRPLQGLAMTSATFSTSKRKNEMYRPASRTVSLSKSPFWPFAKLPSKLQNFFVVLFCNFAAAAGYLTRKDTLTVSLYYRVVVFIAPIQGLCYTVRDAVDWFRFPTARRFLKGSNHSPLQYC